MVPYGQIYFENILVYMKNKADSNQVYKKDY